MDWDGCIIEGWGINEDRLRRGLGFFFFGC